MGEERISLPHLHPALLPGAFLLVALQPKGGRAPHAVPAGAWLRMPSPWQIPTALVRNVPRDPCGLPLGLLLRECEGGKPVHQHSHCPAL